MSIEVQIPPAEPAITHLKPFTRGQLPPEAFDYIRITQIHGIAKAEAKRIVAMNKRELVFLNDTYQVNVQPAPRPEHPFIHLSIKRRDRAPIHDWRDLQAIKNMIVGPEFEAIELYPAESRLVDTANQYHLWVLATGGRYPVGFAEGRVTRNGAEPKHPDDKSVQRPAPGRYGDPGQPGGPDLPTTDEEQQP